MTDTVNGRGTTSESTSAGEQSGKTGGARKGLTIERVHTTEGVHPYDEVTWERRDVVMTNWRDGTINFEQRGVEFPASWSVNATNIVTSKYFRGAVGAADREWSLRQIIDRVVKTYTKAGLENGYFASAADSEIFDHELTWALLHQVFSFNSPVWFNVGTKAPQQVSACFILAVDDTMDSILNWYKEEGFIFKGGSGAGLNLSRIRSSKELLSSGGTASGPVSFMRGADASAGTIKSGGATRRAAKMVVLDVDHPDIEEFIETKAREEDKIRVLRDAGFDMDLGGVDITSVQYQNANNSVRVSDEFMRAVDEGGEFGLRGRKTGEVLETVDARTLFDKIAHAAWACADPGIQYDDTINDWHTTPDTGRITASNPCCFTGDTLIDTADGPVRFDLLHKRLDAGESLEVRSYDLQTGEFVLRPALRSWVAGRTAELVDVVTDNGLRLRSTPEHRYLTEGQWVEAQHLVVDASLVSVLDGQHRVRAVEQVLLADPVEVYDLEVEGTHNFVASSEGVAGVVVHNSEYMHLDNSSCNLASLNLMKFLGDDDVFDAERFAKVVELVITAMDISICFADFPTEAIGDTTRAYRQLGIGYANLGAMLMATGHGYDSEGGRAVAAAITSLMTGTAYKQSAILAGIVGPYDGYARNEAGHQRIMRKHAAANDAVRALDDTSRSVLAHATRAWSDALETGAGKNGHGWRNAQASVLAPTGTIGLMMDCDTTGIEPDLALVKFKKLVGGGSMQIVNQTVPRALRQLGYQDEQVEAIVEHIAEHGNVVDAPGLRTEHYEVFDCAMGVRAIKPMGHVKMMAAVQPFLSGAISKCVVGDTLISSADGLVRIGSLYDGDAEDTFRDHALEISSTDGRRKTDAFYYGGTRPVRRATLRSGHAITGTHVHRLLVAGERGLTWKMLGELEPGDQVAVQYGAEMWSTVPASLRDITVSPPYGSQKSVTLPTEMTEELAFLLGAYAAEGHTSRPLWTVVITNSVESVLQRVQSAWQTVFGVTARIERQPGKCPAVIASSKTVVEFMDALGCGSRASTKRIPDAVLRSPHSMVMAFLSGLALDAYVTTTGQGKWAICLDSPRLLDDLQAVMTNMGIVHSRISKYNATYDKTYDEVYASGRQGQLMASYVKFCEPDKADRAATYLAKDYRGSNTADVVPGITGRELYDLIPLAEGRGNGWSWRNRFTFLVDPRTHQVARATVERVASLPGVVLPSWLREVLDGNLHFSPVQTVEDAGEAEVYDISVPETHAFVANGIMNHNTVNMPETATVDEVKEIYFEGWKYGLKALAIYRDNCKVGQPLSAGKGKNEGAGKDEPKTVVEYRPVRKRLPKSRPAVTTSFAVGGAEGYMTASSYPDNGLGEVFLKMSKQGSTLAGMMDAFSIAISIALQYGVPLETYVSKFINMRFEPAGMTDDPDVRMAASIVDYIFRRLALDHLPYETRAALGVHSAEERARELDTGSYLPFEVDENEDGTADGDVEAMRQSAPREHKHVDSDDPIVATARPAPIEARSSMELIDAQLGMSADAPLCMTCGTKMRRAGSCYVCEGCGSTSGCS